MKRIAFVLLAGVVTTGCLAQSNLARNGDWWHSMTPSQRYTWTDAYLVGVKHGVLLRNASLPGPNPPEETWWSSSEPVERFYKFMTASELRDRLDTLYEASGVNHVPVEDAVQCVLPATKGPYPDALCLALITRVTEDRRREAAEAAGVK